MALPSAVSKAWSAFADAIDVSSMVEADYVRFTAVALAAHAGGVGLDALEDQIIDLSGRDGASEFLAGELTMGLDIALRALAASGRAAASATSPAVDPAVAAAAKAAAEKAAADAARSAALSKLSAEERAALGLK
jgi:hypothetical protein